MAVQTTVMMDSAVGSCATEMAHSTKKSFQLMFVVKQSAAIDKICFPH
jgi:hypothetical protein